jgi:hypothetical protein
MLFPDPTTLTPLSAGSTIFIRTMADGEPSYIGVLDKISSDSIKVLYFATRHNPATGMKRDEFLKEVLDSTGFAQEKLDKIVNELSGQGLMKRGQFKKEPASHEVHFEDNPDGDHYILPEGVQTAVFAKFPALQRLQMGELKPLLSTRPLSPLPRTQD